jgi:hypothetical protein
MKTINKRQAYGIIKGIMLGQPDKKADSVYVTYAYSDGPKPECVVGQAVAALGGKPENIEGYNSWITHRHGSVDPTWPTILADAGLNDLHLTEGAAHLFALAQATQDGGLSRLETEAGITIDSWQDTGISNPPTWGEAWKYLNENVPAFKR